MPRAKQIVSAGKPIDFEHKEILQEGERWGQQSVTLVNPVDLGASLATEGATNPTVVFPAPPPRDSSMTNRDGGRGFSPREFRPENGPPSGEGGPGFPPPREPPPEERGAGHSNQVAGRTNAEQVGTWPATLPSRGAHPGSPALAAGNGREGIPGARRETGAARPGPRHVHQELRGGLHR